MKRKKLLFSPAIVMLFCMIGCASSNNFQVKNDYRLERVVYNIDDDRIRGALENEKEETSFKLGQHLEKKSFNKERKRIENIIKKSVDPEFNKELITFKVDTTLTANKFSVEVIVMRNK